MATVKVSRDIAAPVDAVFSMFTDMLDLQQAIERVVAA